MEQDTMPDADFEEKIGKYLTDAWARAQAVDDRRSHVYPGTDKPEEVAAYATLAQADLALAGIWVELAKAAAQAQTARALTELARLQANQAMEGETPAPRGWRK
ncbi:hypothetical protein GCE86_24650 [Micromonospora terminaliae]|uniref:Uncharacterized protein n=1 Tax=Micromonospora terminaliae TaxID=1914461 RepID=A0AAJ3DKI9_9ACTN|nr:hypothetical protein [Micromonospora terminaliae]NES29897.1 hypothetical protein [Micromonospora terminaliae]QGL49928.1 hypothetical protein GCE86_24650 [Micromonospora terminaliae]